MSSSLCKLGKVQNFNQQTKFQIKSQYMRKSIFTLLLFVLIIGQIKSQLQFDGYIETRKLFLFGPNNGFDISQFGSTHNFLFQRVFSTVPRVGLSVYTLDFEYSPDFSCRITAATNQSATAIQINSASTNVNNLLYIMYMATDNTQIGILATDRLMTTDLSLPTRTKSMQKFDFNYKEQISKFAKTFSDITLTVYLTGISTTSEMTTNGFPQNMTSLSLVATSSSTQFYSIQVIIGDSFQNVLIDWVECTIVYFIPAIQIKSRYQMNSGVVTLQSYGGTVQPVTTSVNLLPLQLNPKFENLNFFYGISTITCKDGASIALLGVQNFYTSPQDKSIQLFLQMQTWKLNFMQLSSFNYVQYKSLKCTEPGANCTQVCVGGVVPYFVVQGLCSFCHYTCLTCNVSVSNSICDTCDASRKYNPTSKLCDCISGNYQTFVDYTCPSCFPCLTCDKASLCLTCSESLQMTLNIVKNDCQCKAGFYPNYVGLNVYSQRSPCLACPLNCLYCTNATNCAACSMQTYLSEGKCMVLCSSSQISKPDNTCASFPGDLFDQQGRLGMEWSYQYSGNQMNIYVTFSQADMAYYYTENGIGYTYSAYQQQLTTGGIGGGADASGSSIYYDDGANKNGYDFNSQSGGSGSGFGSGFGSGGSGGAGSGSGSGGSGATVDQSALKGQYYGLGETTFFKNLYQNETAQSNLIEGEDYFLDQNGIPYGKHNLSSSSAIISPTFVDALGRNLKFMINNDTIPYTIQGISSNEFILRTFPSKTYTTAIGSIQIQNQGLIRSNRTTLQTAPVTKLVERFDFYTSSQLSTASSIQNSNEVFVGILWGLCKYFLFVGFGWPFMPIMLSLQYIMSFNYINAPIPLNLNSFLASFSDFRNPSLLYNPSRNDFDERVVNHPNIYKNVAGLNRFDHGLDFMKNCWEFFFIPLLAVALLGLLYLLNLLFRKCCRRDFCLISKYLVPRAPLLIGAYTLVQALPVSFFFFSQLKDTTFSHPLQPNGAYPTFNTAMAYLAFFLTCTIPILLLAWLYYHFNYGSRISKFSDANVFNRKFLDKIQNSNDKFNRAQLSDPLWGGDHSNYGPYILGVALFALPILFGFFLAFFINNFAWQLAGIILFTVLFVVFIIVAAFFVDVIFKIFFIVMGVLMLAYLLLHAGIGSNRAIGTSDQWNTGYLGVGILYALLLTAILFTGYLLYRLFKAMYKNHHQFGCWIDIDKKNDVAADKPAAQRVTQYRNDTRMKSTYLKGSQMNMNQMGLNGLNQNLIGTNSGYNFSNNQQFPNHDYVDNLASQQRMIIPQYQQYPQNDLLDQLILSKQDKSNQQITLVSKNNNMLYGFPWSNGQMLMQRQQPLYVDADNRIYDGHKDFIDYYFNLVKNNNAQVPIRDIASGQSLQTGLINNVGSSNGKINNDINMIGTNANMSSNVIGMGNNIQTNSTNSIGNSNNVIVLGNNGNQVNRINAISSNSVSSNNNINLINAQNIQDSIPLQKLRSRRDIFVIDNVQFQKLAEQQNGNIKLKNIQTGQIKVFNGNNLKKSAQSVVTGSNNISAKNLQGQGQGIGLFPSNTNMISNANMMNNTKIMSNTNVISNKNMTGPQLSQRHIIYQGQQHVPLGYQPSSKQFKLLNLKTNNVVRLSQSSYMQMVHQSLAKRINVNGEEYDVEGNDANGRFLLVGKNGNRIHMEQDKFNQLKKQNLQLYQQDIDATFNQVMDKPTFMYQGDQYEELGLDSQGRHRLYSNKLRKHILLNDNEFKSLYGNANSNSGNLKHSDNNLLLLQSAVGTLKRPSIQKEKQVQMKLDSQTSRFYIFQGEKGSKIYIPKDKIDTDLPIQVDQQGNIKQQGRLIVSYQQSRRGITPSQKSSSPQTIQMTSRQGQITQQLTTTQQDKQQVSARDVLDPDHYYKILGMPSEKVVDFKFKPKDVFLTERNIKGKDVMNRVDKIRDKYSTLSILVKGETDQTEEYWLS